MNPGTGLLFVALHALRSSLTPRRGLLMLSIAFVPLGITVLMMGAGARSPEQQHFLMVVAFPLLQFAVPFPALFLGVAVLGDEIEGRTITYLFTRPLPRCVHYLGRLLGFTAAYGSLLVGSVVVTSLLFARSIDLTTEQIAGTAAIAVGGFCTYASLFALLRCLFRRALFLGFLLTFVTEVALSKMPISGLSQCSIWHHLVLLEMRLLGIHQTGIDSLQGIAQAESASDAFWVLGTVLTLSLAAGVTLVQRREFRLPAAVAG